MPSADEAVFAWMEMQDNLSLSIRMLIRDSIERDGYVDIVNRPVVQRPVGSSLGQQPTDDRLAANQTEGIPAIGLSVGESPVTAGEGSTAPTQEPGEGKRTSNVQVDVNDLFAQLRR
ncbi:hypothetical protein ACFRJ9_06210 [Paenarthrobacter sp. NPDC056912]|uniref:hypothetical protein n=1 Tax=Paenarthrobacter sp. NPDC056912 TaxID=3345965 RepID=UPI00366E25E1